MSLATARDLGRYLLDTTSHKGQFVVVHTLSTVVGVNMNAGFDKLPKKILYGGVPRLRLSAQARCRAGRVWSREFLMDSTRGARSRHLPQRTAAALVQEFGHDAVDASHTASALVAAAGLTINWDQPEMTKVMVWLPENAAMGLAQLADRHWDDLAPARDAVAAQVAAAFARPPRRARTATTSPSVTTPAANKLPAVGASVPETIRDAAVHAFCGASSIDLALYGRMLINLPGGKITPASQVAHSLSTDRLTLTADDFVAVDDWAGDDTFGAGMRGQQYLASGTLYGYAALDRKVLADTLSAGDLDPKQAGDLAEQVFVAAMAWSSPSGRRSRTGSAVMPTLVIAAATDNPFSAAPAFASVVPAPAGAASAERLGDYLTRLHRRQPFIGGVAAWLSPDGGSAPTLPATITVM